MFTIQVLHRLCYLSLSGAKKVSSARCFSKFTGHNAKIPQDPSGTNAQYNSVIESIIILETKQSKRQRLSIKRVSNKTT